MIRIKKKKIFTICKPLLFYIRYFLISKKYKEGDLDSLGCFNNFNSANEIPKLFFETNALIDINTADDEFEKAITIATYLRNHIKGGSGIGKSSELVLKKMLGGAGGVCSDFSHIFNVFCLLNDIKVKEWGCIDRFYNSEFGHSFNEIYSSKNQKWIAIDIHLGIIFNDVANNTLFSTIDLIHYLRKGNKLHYSLFGEYKSPKLDRIPLVYSAKAIPFVINNFNNREIDYYFNRFQNSYPPLFINAYLILIRKNHQFAFVLDNYKVLMLPKSLQRIKLF